MKKTNKITNEQLKYILGSDWQNFENKILLNCFCGNCGGSVEIIKWEAELNDLNDAVLRGTCAKCSEPVNRYLEIGESGEYEKRIEEVKKEVG